METLTHHMTTTTPQIGSLLARLGELSPRQAAVALETQPDHASPCTAPDGRLSEPPAWLVDAAVAEQLGRTDHHADLGRETPAADLAHLLSRRQAWQFELVPLTGEGSRPVFVTSRRRAARTLGYVRAEFGPAAEVRIADDAPLYHHLQALYPWDAMVGAWRERVGE